MRAVYNSDIAFEYYDSTVARHHVKHWAASVPALCDYAAVVPVRAKQAALYVRSLFESDQHFALPAAFFNAWIDSDDAAFLPDADPIASALDVATSTPSEFEWDARSFTSFRVANAHPESRAIVNISHEQKSNYYTVIDPCSVVMTSELQGLISITETRKQHTVDTLFIGHRLSSCLPRLFLLKCCKVMPTVVMKPASQQAISDFDTYPLPLDVDSARLALTSASSSSSHSVAIIPAVGGEPDEAIPIALRRLCRLGAFAARVPMDQLDKVEVPTLEHLATQGVVRISADEQGDRHVSLVNGSYQWQSIKQLGNPVEAFRCASAVAPLLLPKLYHMMGLREEGWQPTAHSGCSFSRASPRTYVERLDRPVSYFVTLVGCESIFAKRHTRHFAWSA